MFSREVSRRGRWVVAWRLSRVQRRLLCWRRSWGIGWCHRRRWRGHICRGWCASRWVLCWRACRQFRRNERGPRGRRTRRRLSRGVRCGCARRRDCRVMCRHPGWCSSGGRGRPSRVAGRSRAGRPGRWPVCGDTARCAGGIPGWLNRRFARVLCGHSGRVTRRPFCWHTRWCARRWVGRGCCDCLGDMCGDAARLAGWRNSGCPRRPVGRLLSGDRGGPTGRRVRRPVCWHTRGAACDSSSRCSSWVETGLPSWGEGGPS